jgi:hypothetical protein
MRALKTTSCKDLRIASSRTAASTKIQIKKIAFYKLTKYRYLWRVEQAKTLQIETDLIQKIIIIMTYNLMNLTMILNLSITKIFIKINSKNYMTHRYFNIIKTNLTRWAISISNPKTGRMMTLSLIWNKQKFYNRRESYRKLLLGWEMRWVHLGKLLKAVNHKLLIQVKLSIFKTI